MYLLNIIDDIYSNPYFTTVLVVAIVVLIILFIIVLILGIKDSKKLHEIPEETNEKDIKDITFEPIPDTEKIKEDVTFEMPSLSKNLEDFKKNLEDELLKESNRPFKVVGVNELEDTIVQPVISEEQIKEVIKESKSETNLSNPTPLINEIKEEIKRPEIIEPKETKVKELTELTHEINKENHTENNSNESIPVIMNHAENITELPTQSNESEINRLEQERIEREKKEKIKRLNNQLFSSISLNNKNMGTTSQTNDIASSIESITLNNTAKEEESEIKPIIVKTDDEENLELPELK